jgi:hypothetical protein
VHGADFLSPLFASGDFVGTVTLPAVTLDGIIGCVWCMANREDHAELRSLMSR